MTFNFFFKSPLGVAFFVTPFANFSNKESFPKKELQKFKDKELVY